MHVCVCVRMLEPAGKGNVCFVGNSRLSTFHFLLCWNETSTLPKTWQNGLMCAAARIPTSHSLQQRGRGLPAATSGGHAALFSQSSLLLYFASFTWLNLGFTACISTGSRSAAWPTMSGVTGCQLLSLTLPHPHRFPWTRGFAVLVALGYFWGVLQSVRMMAGLGHRVSPRGESKCSGEFVKQYR